MCALWRNACILDVGCFFFFQIFSYYWSAINEKSLETVVRPHCDPGQEHGLILKRISWRKLCPQTYHFCGAERSLAESAGIYVSFYSGKEMCCTEKLGTYHYGKQLQI